MRLEGTLDAFTLPDILQLLAGTRKTGTLHLRRGNRHGCVALREGSVSAARADLGRAELLRRLVGAGLLSPADLTGAAAAATGPTADDLLAAALAAGGVDPERLAVVAHDLVLDATFELLRWPDGDFSFLADSPAPAGPALTVPVSDVVAEGSRRAAEWAEVARLLPSPEVVLTPARHPGSDPALTAAEWSLLALVDGRRTLREVVELTGAGEFVAASALAALVARGLLVAVTGEEDLGSAWELVTRWEGAAAPAQPTAHPTPEPEPTPAPEPEPAPEPMPVAVAPPEPPRAPEPTPEPVLEAAPEPYRAEPVAEVAAPVLLAPRAESPLLSPPAPPSVPSGLPVPSAVLAPVEGTAAVQPEYLDDPAPLPEPVAPAPRAGETLAERDPDLNKALLLRLIAGVRGL